MFGIHASEAMDTEPNLSPHLHEDHVVVVSSPPRCGVSVGVVLSDSTLNVVSFDIAGTLKQKVGVA